MTTILRESVSPTARLTAVARQLLDRLGVVTREAIAAERMAGGFSALYQVLKAIEEAGRIRRGYFIAGRGAAQFADPGALERLRSLKEPEEEPLVVMLAAADPANPYGASLPWPVREDNRSIGRFAGAQVVLVNGELAAYFSRSERSLLTFFDPADPNACRQASGIARALTNTVASGSRRAVLITEVNGMSPAESPLAGALRDEGFRSGSHGWQKRSEA